MGFILDDIVVDRIAYAVATDTADTKLLYTLTQLSDATVGTTAENKEARDKDGALIKRFWTGKSGTFSAINAMLNLNVVAAGSGEDKVVADSSVESGAVTFTAPGLKTVVGGSATVSVPGYIANSGKLYVLANNGTMGAAVSGWSVTSNVLTLPSGSTTADKYIFEYSRTVTNGTKIENRSDKFPATVRLLLKVLYIDPCEPDVLRAGILELPSFQPSPETSISLTTDGTLDYKGDLQVAYCKGNKVLYNWYFCQDDVE